MLTLGAVLDTLRRHGCCVFLRRLPGADLAVGHGVSCVGHRGVEAGPVGVEAQLRGLADRQARVEAELLRIPCEETFLRRQQRRLLHGIIAAKHGVDAVECSSEVEVASGPAPTGFHVSRSHYLVSGWIDKLFCYRVHMISFEAITISRRSGRRRRQERPTWQRVLVVSQATLGDGCGACVVVVPCLRRISNSIVSGHTSGGIDEGGERGRSEGVGRVGGAVLQGLPQHGEARQTERRGSSTSAAVYLGEEGALARKKRAPDARGGGQRHHGRRRRE